MISREQEGRQYDSKFVEMGEKNELRTQDCLGGLRAEVRLETSPLIAPICW